MAEDYFEEEKFRKFCDKHLSHLDEAFVDFFEKGGLDQVIVDEVRVSRFPKDEHEKFINEYHGKIAKSVANRLYEKF